MPFGDNLDGLHSFAECSTSDAGINEALIGPIKVRCIINN